MKENQEIQATKPQKIKKSYAFWPEVAQMIETHKYVHNGKEIAFITQAIKNYCAEIDGEKNLDVLVNRMYKIISAEVDNHSDRMASMLFKLAVEIAILNYRSRNCPIHSRCVRSCDPKDASGQRKSDAKILRTIKF